jgi:serine phosphatase RsbU (regulator of sigma subunit)
MKLQAIMSQHREAILARWVALQQETRPGRALWPRELERQSGAFLDVLIASPTEGLSETVRTAAGALSAEQAAAGVSPTETATFVLSLKQAVLPVLEATFAQDPHALVDVLRDANLYLDQVALATFVAYVAAREDVIRQQAVTMAEQTRLLAMEREVIETLQRHLLPTQLPKLPGLEIAAKYLPAEDSGNVGGDWYDVLTLSGARVGLVMGDVAGKGILAAAVMGQVRSALRAYATEGHPPAVVLDQLQRLMEPGEMVTAVYVTVDLDKWTLHYANAGHLPPMLVRPDGTVHLLPGGQIPLGGQLPRAYRTEAAGLVPGGTLVLYTDGLVEVRGKSLDDRLTLLQETLAAANGHSSADAILGRVLETLLGGRAPRDDVALLVARVPPPEVARYSSTTNAADLRV